MTEAAGVILIVALVIAALGLLAGIVTGIPLALDRWRRER